MRRWWTVLIFWAVLLAACSAPPSPQESAAPTRPVATPTTARSEQVTISFATWEAEHFKYRPLVRRFMDEHPGITVRLVSLDDIVGSDSRSFISAQKDHVAVLRRIVSAADTAPSFVLPPAAFGTLLLLDLKPLMEADPTFQRDDFFPGTIERYTAKDGIWVLPYTQLIKMIRYHRDLFQRAGLPEPRPGWTWRDLLDIAEQMAKTGDAASPTYGFVHTSPGDAFPFLISLLEDQGIDISRIDPATVDLTAPEYVAVIERARELHRRGVVMVASQIRLPIDNPSQPELSTDETPRLVREGRVAMWSDGYVFNDDGSFWKPDFSTGVAPWPPGRLSVQYTVIGGGFIISGGTAHPEAAWRWIEWLSRQPDLQLSGAFDIGYFPTRRSMLERMEAWNTLDPQDAEAYRWALEHGQTTPELSRESAVVGALAWALYAVATDPQADVRQALLEEQRRMQEARVQIALTPTATPDLRPVVVATPAPLERPAGTVTIRFGADFPYHEGNMDRLIRAFHGQRQNVAITANPVDWSAGRDRMSATELAQTSDCVLRLSPLMPGDERAFVDLRPLLDADPAIPRDDFFPGALDAYTKDGRIYGLPYAIHVRALIYNNAAFQEAGIEPPRSDWTPDDFLAAALALASGDGDQRQWGYVPFPDPRGDLLFFVNWLGARLTTGEGADLRPNYTDPKTIAAIRWHLELSTKHRVAPPLQFRHRRDTDGTIDYASLAFAGRGAMYLGDWFPPTGMGENARDLRYAPLPGSGAGALRSEVRMSGLFISAKTQHPQACWAWFKFLSSNPTMLARILPARRSVAESEAFLQVQPSDQRALIDATRATLKAPVRTTGDPDIINHPSFDTYWLFEALTAVIKRGASLEQELAEAQRMTTAYVDCLAQPSSTPAACARQVDPQYWGFNIEDSPPR